MDHDSEKRESHTDFPTGASWQSSSGKIGILEFKVAVAEANQHFTLIRKKYPDLKAYLVLSLLGGQVKVDSSLQEIVGTFPALFVSTEAKANLMKFLKVPEPKEATEDEKKRWNERFQELSAGLEFDGKCQVEIRFSHLDYELIWKLQADDLVDRDLTPQTKASIRIVLGAISHFHRLEGNRSGNFQAGQLLSGMNG